MAGRRTVGEVLRENGAAMAVAVLLLALVGAGVRYASRGKGGRPRPAVRVITAEIKPPAPPPPREPPPPLREEPKEEPREEEPRRLVEVKAPEIAAPQAPRSSAPGGGEVALAGEATGEGDEFGLQGSRSTRSLVGSGGVNGGGGDGIGTGAGDGNRFGWYFGRIASEIQGALQRLRRVSTAEARVEIRIWVDPSGKVSRLELLRSTGDEELDRAIRSVVGLQLSDAPPADLPNPAVYRFVARRPG